jgi:hypothetical protein
VGRSSFEMARSFKEVIGIDLSQTFIDMANQVKADGSVAYRLKVEGDISTEVVANIDPEIDAPRCTFLQVGVLIAVGCRCVVCLCVSAALCMQHYVLTSVLCICRCLLAGRCVRAASGPGHL